MNIRKPLLAALLLTAFCPTGSAHAQSDAQTLRSAYASIGLMLDADFGLPLSAGRRYPLTAGGQLVAAYQFNHRFTAGIGAGFHGYGPSDMLLVPVFVDGRIHFPLKKWTPFFLLDAGYAFALSAEQRGGPLVAPGAGARVPLSDNAAVAMSLGYRWQRSQAPVDGVLTDFQPGYLSARLGLVFRFPGLTQKAFKAAMPRMREKAPKKGRSKTGLPG